MQMSTVHVQWWMIRYMEPTVKLCGPNHSITVSLPRRAFLVFDYSLLQSFALQHRHHHNHIYLPSLCILEEEPRFAFAPDVFLEPDGKAWQLESVLRLDTSKTETPLMKTAAYILPVYVAITKFE